MLQELESGVSLLYRQPGNWIQCTTMRKTLPQTIHKQQVVIRLYTIQFRAQPVSSLTCGLRAYGLHIRERTYWSLAVCKKVVFKGAGEVGSYKGTAVWSELEGTIKCSLSALIQVCQFCSTMPGACCQSLMNSVLSVKITVQVWCVLRLGWVRKLQTLNLTTRQSVLPT